MILPSFDLFTEAQKKAIGHELLSRLIPFFVSKFTPSLLQRNNLNITSLTAHTANQAYSDSLKLAFAGAFIECISGRPIAPCIKETEFNTFINIAALSAGIDPAELQTESFRNFIRSMVEIEKVDLLFSLFLKEPIQHLNNRLIEETRKEKNKKEITTLDTIPTNLIVKILEKTLTPPYSWLSENSSLNNFIHEVIKAGINKNRETVFSTSKLTQQASTIAKKLHIDITDASLKLNQEEREDLIFCLNLLETDIDPETISIELNSSSQSSTQAMTILEKLEPLIKTATTHEISKPNETEEHAEGYVIRSITPDGDCGYSCFNVTRANALALILDNLHHPQIQLLLTPLLEEIFLIEDQKNKFFNYLKNNGILAEEITLDYFSHNLNFYKNNLNILKAYLEFDIKHKQIDAGWAHPLILQAIAHIKGLNLRLWETEPADGKLKQLPQYSTYQVTNPEAETLNLLFHSASGEKGERNNHFSVITRIGNSLYPIVDNEPTQFDPNFSIILQNYDTALKVIYLFLAKARLIDPVSYDLNEDKNNLNSLVTQNMFQNFRRPSHATGNLQYLAETAKSKLFTEWYKEKITDIENHAALKHIELVTTSQSLLACLFALFSGKQFFYSDIFSTLFENTIYDLLSNLSKHLEKFSEIATNFNEKQADINDSIVKETENEEEINKFIYETTETYKSEVNLLSQKISPELVSIALKIQTFQNEPTFQNLLSDLQTEEKEAYIAIIDTLNKFILLFNDILNAYTQEIKTHVDRSRIKLKAFLSSLKEDLEVQSEETIQRSPKKPRN